MNPLQRSAFLLATMLFASALSLAQTEEEGEEKLKPLRPTEIESEQLRMENDGQQAYFVFTNSVILTATNLELLCDKLEVFVDRKDETKAAIGDLGSIKNIVATGNVQITQEERVATAGLVEVLPAEEQIVLKQNPTVKQSGTTLTGLEMIIQRGKGIVIIPGNKQNKVRFVGPSIKDLGFETDKDVKRSPDEEENPEETEPQDRTGEEENGPEQEQTADQAEA